MITIRGAAYAYLPDGSFVGTMSVERLCILYNRFESTRKANPAMFAKQKAGTFEAEIAQLLLRYADGARKGTLGRKVNMKNHWAVPEEVIDLICKCFQLKKER